MAGFGIGGETGQDKSVLNIPITVGGPMTGPTINFGGSSLNKLVPVLIVGALVYWLWGRKWRVS